VIKAKPETDKIVETIIEFVARAKFAMRSEVYAAAVLEVPYSSSRGDYPFFPEVDVEPEATIPVKRTFARAQNADERRHNPQHIAEAVFAQCQPRNPAARLFIVRQHVEGAAAERDPWRIGGGAEGDLRGRGMNRPDPQRD